MSFSPSGFHTPPQRRSLGSPRRHSVGSPLRSRELNILPNDAEIEKIARRRSFIDNQRKSLTETPVLPSRGPSKENSNSRLSITSPLSTPRKTVTRNIEVVTPQPRLPLEQMHNNFEEWIKMATDNKINRSNSWKLALIDYFHEMAFLKDGDSINFQKASCTLDGCVKIYTSRVDSVATETERLLSGLADSTKNRFRDEEDSNQTEEAEEDQDAQTKQRRKKPRTEQTLAKDPSAICVKDWDLEYQVDPLWKKMAADFDEGGARGLLLNQLAVDAEGRIVFDTSEAVVDDGSESAGIEMDMTKLVLQFRDNLRTISAKDICPTLKSFNFHPSSTFDTSNLPSHFIASPSAPQFNMFNTTDDIDAMMTTDADILDDAFNDSLENPFLVTETDAFPPSSPTPNNRNRPVFTERDIIMGMAVDDNMFSYFDSAFLRNWAGPEHWKIRSGGRGRGGNGNGNGEDVTGNSNDGDGENEQEDRQPRRRPAKEPFFVDFHSDNTDGSRLFVPATTSINLPKAVEKSGHRYLLPDDIHFNSKQLLQLFIKPRCKLGIRRAVEEDRPNDQIPEFGDDSAPDVSAEFWATHADDQFSDAGFFRGTNATNAVDADNDDDWFDFDDCIGEQASRVRPEFVNYAKTAKRVDVKKLKENIWKTLVNEDNAGEVSMRFCQVNWIGWLRGSALRRTWRVPSYRPSAFVYPKHYSYIYF
ncbi:7690_t:CDS:2 [Paraglomus occultum]|uniref:Condensin complex subunit 2 n=1 Tax=Paraglomus occultum TaxID=144539 RepID=A0A9N9AWG8_9GLOM|nr:7690_t:CDS:2 [Paraglomus occultum]